MKVSRSFAAFIEQNKSIVLALARALIDHPERTLNAAEIDQVIAAVLAGKAAEIESHRRRDWRERQASAARLVTVKALARPASSL